MNRSEEMAWLAGLFDGEGCVSWNRQTNNQERVTLRLTVGVTHKETMVRVRRILNWEGIQFSTSTQQCKSGARMYMVNIGAFEAVYSLAELLLPYSVTKRDQLQRIREAAAMMQPYFTSGPRVDIPERLAIHKRIATYMEANSGTR